MFFGSGDIVLFSPRAFFPSFFSVQQQRDQNGWWFPVFCSVSDFVLWFLFVSIMAVFYVLLFKINLEA